MIAVSSTVKTDCNSDNLKYKEYILVGVQTVEIRGKMSNSCYNDGNIFGTFIMKKLEFTTENDIDYKGKEVIYYKSVNGEAFKIGTYIVTEIKDNDSDETVTVTALDYGLKSAVPYVSSLDYASGEVTLFNVLTEACSNAGLTLANESITNGDFIVDSNQFTNNELIGDVIKAVAHISGNFATINEDDKVELVYEEETGEIIEDYEELVDKRDTLPFTSVSIGTSQVSGQEAILRDEDMIAEYGEHWLILNDNPFAYTLEKRQELVTAIFNKVKGFSYSSFESSYSFKPYLQLGDKIQFRNKAGELVSSRVLKIDTDYEDIKLSAPSIIKATVDYENSPNSMEVARRAEVIANQATSSITSLAEEQDSQSTQLTQINQTVDEITATVQKIGGNNLVKNSAMKNGTNFWFAHLLAPYIESDTPPTEELYDGAYWYCSSNYEDYQLGVIYRYESGNWIETTLTRKYIDDAQNLLKYMTQYENDYTRQNTLSNSMIKLDGGTNLDISHIFSCTNPIDIIKGQDYITLSFKLKNSMKTGVGYIALGFTEKYIDNAMAEILYSLYEPCFWFTPDDVKELTKFVLTVKVPQKGDFIEATAGLTAPTTNKMWLDLNTYQLKEYNEETETWERKQTILPCYETTTRQIWAYRQLFDIYYETPVNFDNFEIKCVYPAFTMYPEFMRLIPSDVPPTPFKGAYWLNVVENVYRAKYDGDEFVEWEDTGISTEYIMTHPFPTPPFPTQYGVPLQGYYEVADIKAEWNKVATEWSAYPGEIYGKNVKIDEKGMHIISGQNTMFIDEDEIIAKFNDQPVFIISKDLVQFTKLLLIQQMQMGSYIFESRNINSEEHLLIY